MENLQKTVDEIAKFMKEQNDFLRKSIARLSENYQEAYKKIDYLESRIEKLEGKK